MDIRKNLSIELPEEDRAILRVQFVINFFAFSVESIFAGASKVRNRVPKTYGTPCIPS